MNDRHLFRGKSVRGGAWKEGALCLGRRGKGVYIASGSMFHVQPIGTDMVLANEFYAEVDPATIGQYTGLRDRNGAPVFEGDVLKYAGKGGESEPPLRAAYCPDAAGWRLGEGRRGMSLDAPTAALFEVAGNVHDNPELLEGGGAG